MKKNQNAITLISLAITIIVLLIISGITISGGKEIIQNAKLEELRTNMLLIKAKAREYVEKANFEIGYSNDEEKKNNIRSKIYEGEEEAALRPITEEEKQEWTWLTEDKNVYVVTKKSFEKWGLKKIGEKIDGTDEKYIIYFQDESNETTDISVEIYNSKGYKDKEQIKYSLTDIDNIE
ncbi:MAG: hypothetical protein HUJ68_02330 [Clostridia bacterium]|nr:hypothetical protein [Clostridia bacterium]